jgi:polar amino acid transport system ATP-binding protein
MMPLELREKEKKRKQQNYLSIEEIKDKSLDIITKVGLIDKINNYPHELSGGEKQRLAIARAVILGPDILCFDEPTSALDPLLTAEVLKVINEIKDKIKKTMIIVTHEMEFAKRISDKVIFMEDGKIVEEGSSIDLFENPKTKNLKQFLASY